MNTNDSQGIYVIIVKPTKAIMKKGHICLNMLSNFSFATAAPTNKLHPYGGVHKPTAKFTAIITPKWTGLIPNALTVGINIGAITMIAGTVSKKRPINSNTIFIKINTTNGFEDTLVRKVVII
jgi:hypothetical protein